VFLSVLVSLAFLSKQSKQDGLIKWFFMPSGGRLENDGRCPLDRTKVMRTFKRKMFFCHRRAKMKKKNCLQYFGGAFKKYAVFSGRARRAEFWWFMLFSTIISSGIGGFIGGYFGLDTVSCTRLASLVFLLPAIGVWVRRMHDVGKSGWFCFVPIYDIILACTAGTEGQNRFGADPKELS
jgi:uncharacterized membrane protein YhaH (DUF805 family)